MAPCDAGLVSVHRVVAFQADAQRCLPHPCLVLADNAHAASPGVRRDETNPGADRRAPVDHDAASAFSIAIASVAPQ